jgi:hypothetical protein
MNKFQMIYIYVFSHGLSGFGASSTGFETV